MTSSDFQHSFFTTLFFAQISHFKILKQTSFSSNELLQSQSQFDRTVIASLELFLNLTTDHILLEFLRHQKVVQPFTNCILPPEVLDVPPGEFFLAWILESVGVNKAVLGDEFLEVLSFCECKGWPFGGVFWDVCVEFGQGRVQVASYDRRLDSHKFLTEGKKSWFKLFALIVESLKLLSRRGYISCDQEEILKLQSQYSSLLIKVLTKVKVLPITFPVQILRNALNHSYRLELWEHHDARIPRWALAKVPVSIKPKHVNRLLRVWELVHFGLS